MGGLIYDYGSERKQAMVQVCALFKAYLIFAILASYLFLKEYWLFIA